MDINFYGLPEFISISILFGIACVLIRQRPEYRLLYWLVAWFLIFFHAAIFMLLPASFPFDVIARGTLALAGQVFILAAYYQSPMTIPRPRLLKRLSLAAVANLAFALASAPYAGTPTVVHDLSVFYLLTALGLGSTLWLSLADVGGAPWETWVSVALTVLVYLIQALCLNRFGVTMASQWLMCWTYAAVAYFFVRQTRNMTMGVFFTALSFVLWALVFPVYTLLMLYAPAISRQIEGEAWNLPKFLAAASLILVLLEERVQSVTHLATHDELTGLPNRRLCQERLDQAIAGAGRNGLGFGFLVIDLDRFKSVNDTLGHQAGDDLLKVVSTRFRTVLRKGDTLARTGGDEFTVLLHDVGNQADAETVCDALTRSLEAPVTLQNRRYYPSASIGAAIYPADGSTPTELHAVADARMYSAKKRPTAGLGNEQLSDDGCPA